jgi:hypothetical protein
MPRLTDTDEIRRRLRNDLAWSLYALGDLAPPMIPKTRWFEPDLTLIFEDYGTTILFAMGPGSVREALQGVEGPVHLQVQRDALDEIARLTTVSSVETMWRMIWTGDHASVSGGSMRTASHPAKPPTSSSRRWSPTACSTVSTKARSS